MTAEEKWKAAIEECGAELLAQYPCKEFYLSTKGDNVKLFYFDENDMGPWDDYSPYGMILLPSLEEIRKNEAFREYINDSDDYSPGLIDDYNAWFDGELHYCPLDGEDLYNFVDDCPDGFDTADYTIYDNDLVKKTVKFAIYVEVEVPENADDEDIRQAAMDKAEEYNYNIFEDAFFEEITND